MRQIAAMTLLAFLLITGQQHARAAETATVITLTCDGKVLSGPPTDSGNPSKVERVSNMSVVVNLTEHTVTGFRTYFGEPLIARIYHVDDTSVDFTGGSSLGNSSSIAGGINRVTGAAMAFVSRHEKDTRNILGSRLVGAESYHLVCKVTNRLF